MFKVSLHGCTWFAALCLGWLMQAMLSFAHATPEFIAHATGLLFGIAVGIVLEYIILTISMSFGALISGIMEKPAVKVEVQP